ncbi:putative Receptor-like serine/threonine-protein kinase [Cocos nucifera]|uniref:Putative Receptor-like serine/threonine-protein kinase n=1 Tax=Cocos nucifera TaxID=13894 RepID=A0A8K0I290_COCNU|nr:putative Receptor-like serine/threonine-protein kinase [Cocos nucifera]
MDFDSLQGEHEFQNELALIGKMLAMASSPNYGWVVALLGYCSFDKKHHRQWWWRRWEVHKEEPNNILLDAYLSAKIIDFGLARLKTPIADDLQAALVSPASNLGDNEVAIEIMPNKAMIGDSKSFLNVKESAVGGGKDDASIMGETAESNTMTAEFEESIGCGGLAINGGGLCA